MDYNRLYEILAETTVQLRKGPEMVGRTTESGMRVVDIFAMPHESEGRPDLERVDMELLVVGVDRVKAERIKDELVAILRGYPERERLAAGPSYIEVGAEIGDQGAAFQLFALGKVLGLWHVITPGTLGITGRDAEKMIGLGYIVITGFRGT